MSCRNEAPLFKFELYDDTFLMSMYFDPNHVFGSLIEKQFECNFERRGVACRGPGHRHGRASGSFVSSFCVPIFNLFIFSPLSAPPGPAFPLRPDFTDLILAFRDALFAPVAGESSFSAGAGRTRLAPAPGTQAATAHYPSKYLGAPVSCNWFPN